MLRKDQNKSRDMAAAHQDPYPLQITYLEAGGQLKREDV